MRLLRSPILDRWGRQMDRPVPPVEIAEAVGRWFRDNGGRSARLEWHDMLGCWVIKITRKADDPVMELVRLGLQPEAVETVPLHEPAGPGMGYVAMDLEQMGVGGLITMLERCNTWSGRGEFASLTDAVRAWSEREERKEIRLEEMAYEDGRAHGAETRRHALGIPMVRGADLH